ncbi:MAG: inorganic phosphate transporter [Rhizobiales bacterium]|nr:inorganic phosphate transporter [Hyphomicrobiales bacterium]
MDMGAFNATLVFLIFVALFFDFINGMHDSANAIATVVSTRVLKPFHAVLWAGFFNFAAFFVFEAHVAATIGKGIVQPDLIDNAVVCGALAGAIAWNLITWWGGIPSSSSHALVGGIVGAGVAKAGFDSIEWSGLSKTIYAIVLSPFTGFVLAILLMILMSWLFVRAHPSWADGVMRKLQLVASALYSLGHGSNDAQKTAGIIAVLLYSNGVYKEFTVPDWAIFSCYVVMGLGTMMGGWRIVHTMGSRITKLTPMQGACANTAGAVTLFAATNLGIPVSTTHTITGAIVGAGTARRANSVRWGIASSIVWAWVVTIPSAAILSALSYYVAALFL